MVVLNLNRYLQRHPSLQTKQDLMRENIRQLVIKKKTYLRLQEGQLVYGL